MNRPTLNGETTAAWRSEGVGPATLAEVMSDVERQVAGGDRERFRPLPTGFDPLDDVLNGGLRRGDLLVIGGAFGVGKTIFSLQVARNVARSSPESAAVYICYEHDRAHLMSRLLCLESAERGDRDNALTLRKLGIMALGSANGSGLVSKLRQMPRYAGLLEMMNAYAQRLVLVQASGSHSTLDSIGEWVQEMAATGPRQLLVVVDYLQKIPVYLNGVESEAEVTTYQVQRLKDLAMSMGVSVIAIAASDRVGLQAKRMRLTDLRGSSAIQYEADIGLVLNNKYAIVSREHLVYNPAQAEAMRNWVVMSVEKNRSGRTAIDMEYALDAAHFRFVPTGDFVRERLVDEKVIMA
ncbi:MAG: DnaB helicase C-terminal domain-containing protein [Ardenticatenaceae bacterium]|nr:DnaB helicase C-terminal domain-containing protein [Ardenticatenaceae bacterium]HBY97234.1 hypothetical protein [Chloroflexota bacterium]